MTTTRRPRTHNATLNRLRADVLVSRTLAAGLTWAAADLYATAPAHVLGRRPYSHRHPDYVNGLTAAQRDRAARWTVAYVLYEAGATLTAIGRALDMDHTSVRHAVHNMPADWEAKAAPLVDRFARTGVAA